MRQFVLVIAILLLLLVTPCANARSFDRSFQHSGHRVRIVFPEALEATSPELLNWTHRALITAEARLGLSLKQDVEIYFDSRPSNHNGLATVVPRNRIFVHTEAPDIDSSIGISRFYLMETLVHEWGHMLSLQEHRGVFRPMSWVLGHTSRPNGSWPRWIHEGLAVWTEQSVGGRPLSGSVDFDLRRYAEYSLRTKKPALTNSMLDGSWELKQFRPGQVPYSFGYLLLEHLERERAFSLGRFTETSSKSLGLSFRKTFQEMGIDLTEEFQKAEESWAKTPLHVHKSPAKTLAASSTILGLNNFGTHVSWIESGEEANTVLAATVAKEFWRRTWPFDLLSPQEAFLLERREGSETWAVVVDTLPDWLQSSFHSMSAPFRRRLVIWNSNRSTLQCVFDLGDRMREIDLQAESLAWVTSQENGRYSIQSAKWDRDCGLSELRTLAQGEAFERLASPHVNGEKLFYTQNIPSNTAYDERIRDEAGREIQITAPSEGVLVEFAPHATGNALIFEKSRNYWGPLLLQKTAKGYSGLRLPLRTGATEAVLSDDGKQIYYIEKLWDRDEVLVLPADHVSLRPSKTLSSNAEVPETSNEATPGNDANLSSEPVRRHLPIDDMWPHFWIPSLLASQGAWILAGQTFYSDLTKTWNGSTFLGYNTSTRRPFGSTALSWVSQTGGTWPQVDLSAEYNPRDVSFFGLNGQRVQERAAGSLALTLPYSLRRNWQGSVSFGYTLRYSGNLGVFDEVLEENPFLRFTFRSRHGRNPYTNIIRMSESPPFLHIQQRARWLTKFEGQSDIYGLLKTSERSRLLLAGEAAYTRLENFPRSYFYWGGIPLLGAGYDDNYLNRGFPTQGFVAKRLARVSSEWIWGIWTPRSSFSWNRLRLQSVDLRLIGESISWESFFNPANKIGKTFSSSLGAEVDILGSGLHYISYKLSVGAFHGFGNFGGTQYTAQLRMGLDL